MHVKKEWTIEQIVIQHASQQNVAAFLASTTHTKINKVTKKTRITVNGI